jgi:glycosyltransferase involved in cell wall biosynthesis
MKPKISFMMLLFNGLTTLPEGMLKAAFDQVKDVAHEIYVVEGATELARFQSDTGRSTDGTVDFIHDLMRNDKRIKLIQHKGHWKDKNHMVRATNTLFTGDYVWQLDSDEIYHENDIPRIVDMLETRKPFEVDFFSYVFWGGYTDCVTERSGRTWTNEKPKRRIFLNKPGHSFWMSHNPPWYCYDEVIECADQESNISREEMLSLGIKIHHYSYVTRQQAAFKTQYYGKSFDYLKAWDRWQIDKTTKLVMGSTTEPFALSNHPKIIKGLIGAK